MGRPPLYEEFLPTSSLNKILPYNPISNLKFLVNEVHKPMALELYDPLGFLNMEINSGVRSVG